MKLIYCHIKKFRNIRNQEVALSDRFKCQYMGGKLLIEPLDEFPMVNYVYGNEFMCNLRIIVGKTGSGKTNLLQMIGMDVWQRRNSAKSDAYFMLYKMDAPNEFFIEMVGMSIPDLEKFLSAKLTSHLDVVQEACKLTYDFEKCEITGAWLANYGGTENTYIINTFDRNAFAYCPYEDERQEGVYNQDTFIGRMVTQFGNSSVSTECDYLKMYVSRMSQDSVKRKTALTIRWDNWQNRHRFDLNKRLVEREYWTYKDKAERQREKNFKNGKYNAPIKYAKGSTAKIRFLHDLMTDFAIYLRKWAECVDEEFPEKYFYWAGRTVDLGIDDPRILPDGQKMSILKRIDWLCQYIDYHTDEINANYGLVWQIGSDIKDIFHLLNRMDDKYFTDEEFSIPVMDIDLSDKATMCEVFERMEQYRPDEVGIFTKCLLPYHWTYVSSGEYQYAKVWGILEEYGVKVKVLKRDEKFSKAVQPHFILLLDEPENYMHPEMCRTFIHDLNELLAQRNLKSGFQMIISTHSPFMLSDVFAHQIIKMDYDDQGMCVISPAGKPSYAANIHSIMADSFFLKYTIGEQARIFLTEKFGLFKDMLKRRGHLSEAEKKEIFKMKGLLPDIGDELIRHAMASIIEKLQ